MDEDEYEREAEVEDRSLTLIHQRYGFVDTRLEALR